MFSQQVVQIIDWHISNQPRDVDAFALMKFGLFSVSSSCNMMAFLCPSETLNMNSFPVLMCLY